MFNKLVISRSVMLTALLLLLSTGTYTYSESKPSVLSIHQKIAPNPLYLTFFTQMNDVKVLAPVNYYWALQSKKQMDELMVPPEQIMGMGATDISKLEKFLMQNNRHVHRKEAHQLAKLYWEESMREGVNPDVAFTQMCLETGFLRFNGTVKPDQHNYCGLGVTGNGVQGMVFTTQQEGVRAHIQHLKAYASTEELNSDLVDSRFRYVKRGCAEEITDLTGKWATDAHYDKKIRSLLHRLYQAN